MGDLMVFDFDATTDEMIEAFFTMWQRQDVEGITAVLDEGDNDDLLLAGWSLAAALLNTPDE